VDPWKLGIQGGKSVKGEFLRKDGQEFGNRDQANFLANPYKAARAVVGGRAPNTAIAARLPRRP
jgi:hypothetical protein